jgi:hypothetical protein
MTDALQGYSDPEGADPSGRCLVFLHLEKTAGSTISSALGLNYPRDRSIRISGLHKSFDQALERIPVTERSRLRIVKGHMPYGVHLYIPSHCDYVTVLREPVGRVVSKYRHILRSNLGQPMHERVVGEAIPLEEYVESGMDNFQTENYQTRLLSGRQFDAPDQTSLQEAKENLRRFVVVGLTERFEETLALLRRTLRLRKTFYIARQVTPQFEPSKRAQEIIRERNQLDLELHAFAGDLFAEHLSMQTRSFNAEVAMYRAMRPLSRIAARGERLFKRLNERRTRSRGADGSSR